MAQNEDWRWWFTCVIWSIGLIIGLMIAIMQSKHVLSDTTKSNKSRKLLTFNILACLYCYCSQMLILVLFNNTLTVFGIYHCDLCIKLGAIAYTLAKMFMYLAFICRLYLVYNNPIYDYNPMVLKIISILVITYALSLCALHIYATKSIMYHGKEEYIVQCKADVNRPATISLGLFDVIFSTGSIIFFVNPLRKIIKSILASDVSKEQRNELNNLIQVGIKYTILTSVASLSSLLFLFAVMAGLALAGPIDFITNMICLILMTPYYNDKDYYSRMCCGTIKCSKLCLGYCCGYSEDTVELTQVVDNK